MATNSVTVLAPNGRRKNVKVTPDTTLLQVLEDVCQKFGFNPEEYDIKHHNKVLDTSSVLRYSGLPNNAFLEMAAVSKHRLESPVILGLHLESGQRVTGEFKPTTTLWEVIKQLKPDEADPETHPVVVYMRKEIIGKSNLETTTLRSLGLTGGRAMVRLIHKQEEELRTQANVSTPLPKAPPKESPPPRRSSKMEDSIGSLGKTSPMKDLPSEKRSTSPQKMDVECAPLKHSPESSPKLGKSERITKSEAESRVTPQPSPKQVRKVERRSTSPESTKVETSPKHERIVSGTVENVDNSSSHNDIVLLGERHAVAYSLDTIEPIHYEDLPDDFFELTVTDAKLLLREARQHLNELENSPLMTSAQREFIENERMLNLLRERKKAVLRIKFPDRTVLQGTFSPVETISAVEDFLKNYLQDPGLDFYLYTSPPKVILKSEQRLLECNCVPSSVLYFGVKTDDVPTKFLRDDISEKFSTMKAASSLAADEYRRQMAKHHTTTRTLKSDSEGASTSGVNTRDLPSSSTTDGIENSKSPPNKVPRWFKPSK